MYGELDVFDAGMNGCAKCICIETRIYCNRTRCPSSTEAPSTTTPTSTTNFEVDEQNSYDPNKEVETLNEPFDEVMYRPIQTGSGTVYRNRARVFIHNLDDDNDTQQQIHCPNGGNC